MEYRIPPKLTINNFIDYFRENAIVQRSAYELYLDGKPIIFFAPYDYTRYNHSIRYLYDRTCYRCIFATVRNYDKEMTINFEWDQNGDPRIRVVIIDKRILSSEELVQLGDVPILQLLGSNTKHAN